MTSPTLADVAREAGVSTATASRVLSGRRAVSSDLTRRVRDACDKLGYRHNAIAGALRSQRSETVGLVLPRYGDAFVSALTEAVGIALEDAGMSVILRYSDPNAQHERENIDALLARRVDGIIIAPATAEAGRETIGEFSRHLPIVQVGRFVDPRGGDSVGLDEDRATDLLVRHLAGGGARRVTVVGLGEQQTPDRRRRGALGLAADSLGIAVSFADPAPATVTGGVEAGTALLAPLSDSIDAIVCANDDVAAGVIAVAQLHGIAVPERLQIASLLNVAFDAAESGFVTTLRHPWPHMGREAVRLLLSSLRDDHDGVPRRVALGPELVIGRSTRRSGPADT